MFYHLSRHLSDRVKRQPVDWNMLGGTRRHDVRAAAATRRRVRAPTCAAPCTDTYVDYTWELDAGVRVHQPRATARRPSVGRRIAAAVWAWTGQREPRHADRVSRRGRLAVSTGTAGAIELFVAVERRIDPYQLEFGTATWASVGMRLLSRVSTCKSCDNREALLWLQQPSSSVVASVCLCRGAAPCWAGCRGRGRHCGRGPAAEAAVPDGDAAATGCG